MYNPFNKLTAAILAPFIYRRLDQPAFREKLYLNSSGRVLFRETIAAVIERKIEELVARGENAWGDKAGSLYDLKHRLHNQRVRDYIRRVHYDRTLKAFQSIWFKMSVPVIVDYGCGPGILTEYLARTVSGRAAVWGLDSRPETISYNKKLRPDINWGDLDELERLLDKEDLQSLALVVDGVVNFMNEAKLTGILSSPKIAFVVFYYSNPLHIDLFRTLERIGYNYDYKNYLPAAKDQPVATLIWAWRKI